MAHSCEVTRRTFLAAAVGVAASPCVIPASALGTDGRPAPSDRVTLGCIGLGGRGGADLNSMDTRAVSNEARRSPLRETTTSLRATTRNQTCAT
jgi:hypothetical protein